MLSLPKRTLDRLSGSIASLELGRQEGSPLLLRPVGLDTLAIAAELITVLVAIRLPARTGGEEMLCFEP
jgi:hypothetical protein